MDFSSKPILHLQKGIALIMALLVMSLVVISTVALTSRQHLDIQRTTHLLNQDQAYVYALGAEQWALWILQRDQQSNAVDHLQETWSQQLPFLPIPGGHIQGQLIDLQGYFNINNLIQKDQPHKESIQIFEQLLTLLDLAPTLSAAFIDWLDTDQSPYSSDGAEDTFYLLKTPAYRSAGRQFTSPTEIRLIAGITEDIYQTLFPFICTLPSPTSININTANQYILRAIADPLSESEALDLIADRETAHFNNIPDFLNHPSLANAEVLSKQLSVSSQYFLLMIQVEIDRQVVHLNSLLYRAPEKIQVLLRSQGIFY